MANRPQCFDQLSIYLQVYDGSITENSLIGKYCGSTPPDAISSRSSSLYVEFFADESINGRGFNATYTIVHGTVDLEIFAKILFSRITLKDI